MPRRCHLYEGVGKTPDALPEVSRGVLALRILPAGLSGGGHHHRFPTRYVEYMKSTVLVKAGNGLFVYASDRATSLVMVILQFKIY